MINDLLVSDFDKFDSRRILTIPIVEYFNSMFYFSHRTKL